MSDIVKCVFCDERTMHKIIKFTPDSKKKCRMVLEYRRSKTPIRKTRLTYNNIELSSEMLPNEGYHAQCYKLFTAIKIPLDFEPFVSGVGSEPHVPPTSTTSQAAGTSTEEQEEMGASSDSEGDLEDLDEELGTDELVNDEELPLPVCFICEKPHKRRHGRQVVLAISKIRTIDTLKSAATEHNDIQMLEKINSFSEHSNIPYHKCCKDQYLRDIKKTEESEFTKKRKVSNTAYTMLCEMLEERVIEKNECLFFDHVKKEYLQLLEEQMSLLSDSISITAYSDRHLERKLMETFNNRIKIIYAERKKFLAPFSLSIFTYNDLFKVMTMKESIRSVALLLRKEILDSITTKLPENCTAEDLIKGECDYVPELLSCFLESFIWGDVSHLSAKAKEARKNIKELGIFSLGQDMIYAASNHRIKTSKHITLGLAVKSLCNSKKIINILSKYGHCCSYTTLEELETEMTFSMTNAGYLCPEDILRRNQLPKAYGDVVIAPGVLDETPESDMEADDQIDPDSSTDEDEDEDED